MFNQSFISMMNEILIHNLQNNKIEDLLKNPNWKEILHSEGIQVLTRDPFYILSYIQGACKFDKYYQKECRGLIIRQSDLSIICRGYNKFFNIEEDDKSHKIEYYPNKSFLISVDEKVDGSIVKLYFNKEYGYWMWATNNSFHASKVELKIQTEKFKSFQDLIEDYLNSIFDTSSYHESFYNLLNKDFTYVFELVSKYHQIVIQYDTDVDLYFHGVVDNFTGINYSSNGNEFKEISKWFNKPNTLITIDGKLLKGVTDFAEFFEDNLRELIENINDKVFPLTEGVVINEVVGTIVTGRIKVKTKKYLEYHYLGSFDIEKQIDEVIKAGEFSEFESVVLKQYPHFKEQYNTRLCKFMKIKNIVKEIYKFVRDYKSSFIDKKAFALFVNNQYIYKDYSFIAFDFHKDAELTPDEYIKMNYNKLMGM